MLKRNSLFNGLKIALVLFVCSGCTKSRPENVCPNGVPGRTNSYSEALGSQRLEEIRAKFESLPSDERYQWLKEHGLFGEFVPGQLLIRFQEGVAQADIDNLFNSIGAIPSHQFLSNGAYLITMPALVDEKDLIALAKGLSLVQGVDYVEGNARLKAIQTPNDPRLPELFGLHNTGQNHGKIDADIDALEAWDLTLGSDSVVVGVIDSGVDYTHPDLAQNIWINPGEVGRDAYGRDKAYNGLDDDGNGFVDDFRGWNFVDNNNDPMDHNGHGTHVSGTIGARGNNGIGVAGVNWRVKIQPLKFLNTEGSGNTADAIRALEYATKMGVPITNNSWGGGSGDHTLRAAIAAAEARGFLFVAAAGNDSTSNDSKAVYPSGYSLPNIIAVAATQSDDTLAPFSNFGANSVHIAAPGDSILSTYPGNRYERLSGTSMAAPHVSGVAALIKAKYPSATYADIKLRILAGSDRLPDLEGKVSSGGRLNAAIALEPDVTPGSPVVGIQLRGLGITTLMLSFPPSGDDGTSGAAYTYLFRFSPTPISTEEQWSTSELLKAEIHSADARQMAILSGLPLGAKGFISVRSVDNAKNLSPLSNPVPFTLREPIPVYENAGDDLGGVQAQGGWGIETDPQAPDRRYFSDSPGRQYNSEVSSSLSLPSIAITSTDMVLSFSTKVDLEPGYDFGIVEISTNQGQSWKEVRRYSADGCDWTDVQLELSAHLRESLGKQLQVRFRMISDIDTPSEGWLIDNLRVYSSSVQATLSNLPRALSNASSLSTEVGGMGITRYRYALLSVEAECESASSYSPWIPAETLLSDSLGVDGAKTLCVWGADDLGHRSIRATRYTWIKDTVAPGVVSVVPKVTGWGSASLTLETDETSQAEIWYYNSSQLFILTPQLLNRIETFALVNMNANAKYYIRIRLRDEAGNESQSAVQSVQTWPKVITLGTTAGVAGSTTVAINYNGPEYFTSLSLTNLGYPMTLFTIQPSFTMGTITQIYENGLSEKKNVNRTLLTSQAYASSLAAPHQVRRVQIGASGFSKGIMVQGFTRK